MENCGRSGSNWIRCLFRSVIIFVWYSGKQQCERAKNAAHIKHISQFYFPWSMPFDNMETESHRMIYHYAQLTGRDLRQHHGRKWHGDANPQTEIICQFLWFTKRMHWIKSEFCQLKFLTFMSPMFMHIGALDIDNKLAVYWGDKMMRNIMC